jgi:hypothetical protein
MNQNPDADDLREEYDFSEGVRGKYADAYREGTNVVLLDSDMAKIFRDSSSVNQALREYIAEHGSPPPGNEAG